MATTCAQPCTQLSGYNRLRLMNQFLPTDIQVAFRKNIGRNDRVTISDFLIGDKTTNLPVLPHDLNQSIKSRPEITTTLEWTMAVKKSLHTYENLRQKNTHKLKLVEYLIMFFRYLNVTAPAYLNPSNPSHVRVARIIYNKADELFSETCWDLRMKYTHRIYHQHNTRANKAKVQENERFDHIEYTFEKEAVDCMEAMDELIKLSETA